MTLLFDKIWGKGHCGEGKGIKDDRKLSLNGSTKMNLTDPGYKQMVTR